MTVTSVRCRLDYELTKDTPQLTCEGFLWVFGIKLSCYKEVWLQMLFTEEYTWLYRNIFWINKPLLMMRIVTGGDSTGITAVTWVHINIRQRRNKSMTLKGKAGKEIEDRHSYTVWYSAIYFLKIFPINILRAQMRVQDMFFVCFISLICIQPLSLMSNM